MKYQVIGTFRYRELSTGKTGELCVSGQVVEAKNEEGAAWRVLVERCNRIGAIASRSEWVEGPEVEAVRNKTLPGMEA